MISWKPLQHLESSLTLKKQDNIQSLELFTIDYGMMRWFRKTPFDDTIDYRFEDLKIVGEILTDTAGKFDEIKLLSENANSIRQHGNYQ